MTRFIPQKDMRFIEEYMGLHHLPIGRGIKNLLHHFLAAYKKREREIANKRMK